MQGRGQAALGHVLYNLLRTSFTEETRGFLHGEIVGVGLRLQALYNQNEDLEERVTKFMKERGMPITLQELGIPNQPEAKDIILSAILRNSLVEDSEEGRERLKRGFHRIWK